MDRAERRRQERAERKERSIIVGDGIAVAGIGPLYEARETAKLPPKVPGEHRWIAFASWVISMDAARTALDPDVPKILDNENMFALAVSCWDCEEPVTIVGADSRCPAPASP